MKKAIKIIAISLCSLIVLVSVIISVTIWFVFTPEKITPFAHEQVNKYLIGETDFKSIELSFFSTYPNFGLKIDSLCIINHVENCPNDTLLATDELIGIIDFKTLWKSNNIILKKAILKNGIANLYTDSLNNTNYDIYISDTTSTEEEKSEPYNIEFKNVLINNINLSYTDETLPMAVTINNFSGNMNGSFKNDILNINLQVNNSVIALSYDNEPYLQSDTLQIKTSFNYCMNYLKTDINNASGTINSLPIEANGIIEEDTTNTDLIFDLSYKVSNSPIENLLPMVPPSYQSYFDGITANGIINIDGTINGIMNDSLMPLFYVGLLFDNCNAQYANIPVKLNEITGNIEIVTDAMTDEQSYVNIKHLAVKTEKSEFEISGIVNQLFSDIYCNLNSNVNLTLAEFNSMIPADMNTKAKGNLTGEVQSAFTLTQLENMEFDKVDISGQLDFSNLDVVYDTLWIKSNIANIDFSIPNKDATDTNTSFAKANIKTDRLRAGSQNTYSALLKNSYIDVETSDIMDTTRIPNIIYQFSFDSLCATIDTISGTIIHPEGKMNITPSEHNLLDPHIELALKTANIDANMGSDNARMGKINLKADIINDSKQEDIVLQWHPTGFFEMKDAHIQSAMLTSNIDIPMITMDFTPEIFNIKESKLIIDHSDFELQGKLTNIHSHFKNDSLMRGQFSFISDNTDIDQLMALTSGIGSQEDSIQTEYTDTTTTGPYMVPKGVDITLTTNIKQATYETDTISDIIGDVIVKNGILTLDDLKLTTPATRIQMTAIYRTPRKNHLYLGLDYHMLDIEIEKLLEMVPDIDSIMSMLRSFKGEGEFHMAIETYLDSLYNLKMSTLRGAASITGNDLVLMDGETFSEIAKTLKFSKKAINKVDSLSAEFTVFKNEVDVYPFLIVIDKYKAVVAGRHNLDMSFDYHISLVESPLPIKLGVDVKGTIDDLSYRLAPCKYAEGYRPSARFTVENKQLELRKVIRQSLVENMEK